MIEEKNLEELARRGPREALQVAHNPSAPGALLARLAQSKDSAILRALAQNPNTPTAVLFRLAKRFPIDVLENPVIPLLFLENPSVLRTEIDLDAAKVFLSLPDCPSEFFQIIATHTDVSVRAEAAAHPKTPSDLLLSMREDGAWMVSHALAKNPNTPPLIIGDLLESSSASLRGLAAKHPNAPQERLSFFLRAGASFDSSSYEYGASLQLQDPQPLTQEEIQSLLLGNEFARCLAALHPDTPLPSLVDLAKDASQQVRIAVASNPRDTEEVFALLDTKEYSIQMALCHNPSTPTSTLQLIQKRQNTGLHKLIAKHPNATEEILSMLATEEDAPLRLLALQSGKINPALLLALHHAGASNDLSSIEPREAPLSPEERDLLLRFGPFAKQLLAQSQHTTELELLRLYEETKTDQSGLLMRGLFKNPNLPPNLLFKNVADTPQVNLISLARREDTPPELLAFFLESQSSDVRTAAAFHRETPLDALRSLWRAGASPDLSRCAPPTAEIAEEELFFLSERGHFARELAALHPKTPTYLLEQLSKRGDYWLQAALLKNPNLPEAAIRNIPASYGDICLKLAAHRNTPWDILQKIIKDNYYGTRAKAAANQNTTKDDLLFLSRDESRVVRDAVAAHPNTPPEALSWLALEPRGRLQLILAQNHATPEHVLQRFSLHSNAEIRRASRANPSLPSDFLALLLLVEAKDPSVPEASLSLLFPLGGIAPGLLAEHPNTPGEILAEIAARQPKSFSLILARHPRTPAALLRKYQTSLNPKLREAVAQNPAAPPLQEPLPDSPWARYLAAQDPSTDAAILLSLASVADVQVREAVAIHHKTPSSALEALQHDAVFTVRCAVARRAGLSVDALLDLSQDRHPKVRLRIALNPQCPSDILAALSLDTSSRVRRAVAQHPNTLPEILQQLARDPKRRVRGLLKQGTGNREQGTGQRQKG